MIRSCVLAAASLAVLTPCSSRGAPVFYADAAGFGAAEPSATAVNVSCSGTCVYASLSVAGVTFSAAGSVIAFNGSVGNDTFGETLVLSFASPVEAVGAYLRNQIAEAGAPPPEVAPIIETVLDGATRLGRRDVTEASGFFGVSSTTPITAVTFSSDCESDCSSLLSTISVASRTAIPEPGGLAALLAGLGALAIARPRARRPPRQPAQRRPSDCM